MPKGEGKKAQSQIDVQGRIAQEGMNALSRTLYPQQNQTFTNYLYGTGTNLNDYNSIMQSYRNFLQNPYGPSRPPIDMVRGGDGVFADWHRGFTPGGEIRGGGDINQGMTQPIQGGNYEQMFNQLFPGETISLGDLMANKDKLESMGMKVVPNAAGNSADIQLPDGTFIDVGAGMSTSRGGQVRKHWNPDAPSGPQSIFGGGPFGPALSQALEGYSDFAKTGGYSPQDIQDLRARAVSPIRSIYGRAQSELDRSRRLTGGGANYAPAAAKMARESSYATGDALTNVSAGLADSIRSGRLAGLGGLSQTGLAGAGQDISARLGAISGMAGLYGTTPGLINTFGNQMLGGQQNLLNMQQLQNQLGLGLTGRQIEKSQIPGDFSQTMGNIGSVIGLGSRIISPFGIFGGGGGAKTGYTGISPKSIGRGIEF